MKTSQKLIAGIGTMLLASAATVSVVAIANHVAPVSVSEPTNILYPLGESGEGYLGPAE